MSAIVVNSFTIPNYNGGGSTASIRIYADKPFLTSDGVRIFKSKAGGSIWYKSVSCTVAGTVITVPQITIDSTTDSDNPDATYTGLIFDSSGIQRDYVFKNWSVPTSLGTPITFAQLVAHNSAAVLNTPGLTYTQEQTIALLAGYYPLASLLRSQTVADQLWDSGDSGNTALSVTVEASGRYEFRAMLYVDCAGSADFFAKIGGTSTDTNIIVEYLARNTSGVLQSGSRQSVRTTGIILGTSGVVEIRGTTEINAGGTFLIYAGQSVFDASATTLLRGSSLILTKTN